MAIMRQWRFELRLLATCLSFGLGAWLVEPFFGFVVSFFVFACYPVAVRED